MTPMAEQWPAASEASAARTVFGPLGGIVELGAVSASESTSLSEISVGDFVADHREELDHFLAMVRDLGDFDAETMAIVDDLGRLRPHEITAPSLLLWSGGIEPVSPDPGEPAAVRRMVNMGVDLQLADMTHGLVGVAAARGGRAAVEANAVLILECLRMEMQVDLPQYLPWADLREKLARTPDSPALAETDQGDFLEYRAAATKVSVLVNNDHEERDSWVGHGDVWSVSLG
ncbi:hypothetical protein [Streptomyces sp. NBC_00306]|uniref:hypothetical protein n=1 Tax=Streptomyces sp. NBC_00306 TaxID=2975708 RepID=UPI002E2C1C42|nr:hypothetical protein [Streptomyces sp. NBC_00306]